MGIYLNPTNINFQRALNSEIYIDKSELIKYTNKVLCTEQQFLCVSRPRRFGKSMTANMLTAYYSKGCDSRKMFESLKIAQYNTFAQHLNRYHVIHLNILDFLGESNSMDEMISFIEDDLIEELSEEFPSVKVPKRKTLVKFLEFIFVKIQEPFIFIIDEWDCVFRMHKNNKESWTKYLEFLRKLLKDKSYVALAYMTGILPVKKYGEHSALNIFTEISMIDTREFSEFTGFTETEVEHLCEKYQMSLEETKQWYDGYDLNGVAIYNPCSVVMSMTGRYFNNYWTSTETYEALKVYIEMNYDGLHDTIVKLIAGEKVVINPRKFQNDMTTFASADDVLTLLVHLGYLTFQFNTNEVWIPNGEVQQEFINSIEDGGWETIMLAIRQSERLLEATLQGEEETVAKMIEQVHEENVSILKYNDENSLSCVISLAYYVAKKSYNIYRELPTGKGFADLVFIPKRNSSMPPFLVELKVNQSVETAIEQIKNKNYLDCLNGYVGEIILVGINYDKESKKHNCKIEKVLSGGRY